MSKCIKCGSYAFNLYKEGIDQGGLCDVHYWQGRAHRAEALAEQPAQQEPVAWMREGWGPDCGPYIDLYRDDEMGWRDRKEWTALYTSPPAQEPVAFLANGTRFKISYDSRQSGGQIHGIPPELNGRWVAFVAADDDCHLKLTSPPAQRTWVGLSDQEVDALYEAHHNQYGECETPGFGYERAIEAKLKEKNGG